MILPPEKSKGLPGTTDGERREFPAPSEKAPQPPLTILEYHPELESGAPPTLLPPFDNAQPPSYSDSFVTSASSSYFAPTSSTTEAVMVVPTAPRVPLRDVMYPSFQPMFMVATGKTLDKGFPYTSPPSKSNPHPFVSHDINEGDWISFLEEARMAATLTHKQIGSSHLPIVSLVPVVGCVTSFGVKRLMKYRNASKVVDCIDKWNRRFFEQRKIRIVLMKGQVKVSGRNEYLNDTPTSNSSNHEFDCQKYYEDLTPSSHTSISQELVGKNDNIYRLFIVPLS